ncbi:FAS1 domain-containing protein [Cutaneotrichosporon oleaginosum]|uniref:FAS1 domain-containing protein n=2 Tax=Cutaneotrichosporon oleaginosum TaxID=879819 RepID=A0A0J0XK41_9TREE|nr:FAS1 domain-containing protein [Cutaneotrichosporon oleaginosum]KLT41463.1 FAS1 domain-containing protein [Cutaneotrichosporon oleaginosum]
MESYSETLMSALTASSKHGTFVHLLQRAKLVPMLSRLNGTIFAPTDEAWQAWEEAHKPDTAGRVHGWLGPSGLSEWLLSDIDAEAALARRLAAAGENREQVQAEADNQNWAMRQHMLYHILNYTLTEEDWAPREESNITIETSLLFPMGRAPTPSPIPEPGTPWTPAHGHGLLGDHGQRLRLAMPGSAEGGERGLVGFDHFGANGAAVWDGSGWDKEPNNTHIRAEAEDKDKDKQKERGVRWVRNGVVVGVDGVLTPPLSLLDTLRNTPQLAYLAQLIDVPQEMPLPLPPSLDEAKHVTLFAASEDAFTAAFDDLERGYLQGMFGVEGLSRVLAPGTILQLDEKHPVGWSDAWGKKGSNVTSASDTLEVVGKHGSLSVNGTQVEVVDIFTANGVIHIVPRVILPEGFELLNSAEKVLLSRNATRFVSLMRSANLSARYIGEAGGKAKRDYTILAPTDDAIDYMGYLGSQGVLPLELSTLLPQSVARTLGVATDDTRTSTPRPPVDDTSPLAQLLRYHILAGSYDPDDIKDGMLIPTELQTADLNGARQPIQAEVSERRKPDSKWDVGEGEIAFGGANVVGQPVKSGDTVIYFMSEILAPPLDTLQTAVGDLQLSTYIAAVYAAGLERSVKRNPATTYFIPRNKAFNNLGLAMKYLLLPEGRDELRKVLRYHAVEQLIYTPDIEVGLSVLKTTEGGNLLLDRSDSNNFTLRSPSKWPKHDSGSASLPSNGDLRPAVMRAHNALTETGVIHIIDSVVLPSDINLSIAKLIRGSKQHTMPELLVKAGFGWILEGREPTDEEVAHLGLPEDFRILGKNGKGEDDDSHPDDLALPAYTVLVPTDKAFSRVNMTYYLSDPEALKRLLKLHIIPSDLGASLPKASSEHAPRYPPADNTPLALEDDIVYPTLLVFDSAYGELGFRAQGDDDFLVGVRNARGGSSDRPARTGAAGRASVRWKASKSSAVSILESTEPPLWRGGMTLGGGVIVIDTVLEPYAPGWFTLWGWLALTIVGAVAVMSLAGVSVWWWWSTTKKKQEGYERVATAEEEARQEEENRHWRRMSRGG